jgi:hypothetical protein
MKKLTQTNQNMALYRDALEELVFNKKFDSVTREQIRKHLIEVSNKCPIIIEGEIIA